MAANQARPTLRRLTSFTGRVSRAQLWLLATPMLLLLAAALYADFTILGPEIVQSTDQIVNLRTGETTVNQGTEIIYGPRAFTLIASLLVGLPLTALLTQRVHDLGYPGWWAWLALSIVFLMGPILNVIVAWAVGLSVSFALALGLLLGLPQFILSILATIVIFLWSVSPSEPGENEYGPNPNEVLP